MTEEQLFSMDVEDWENYFLNRSNTHEVTPMIGGLTKLTMLQGWWNTLSQDRQLAMYPKLVQAVLNRWGDLSMAVRKDYESNPVEYVADLAFDDKCQFRDYLRPYYNRLWQESPRPHGKELCWIALNSQAQLPVSRAEIGLLFELQNWGLIATRIATSKGYTNDAIELLGLLEERGSEISAFQIDSLVRTGFPKLKGLRWLSKFNGDESFAKRRISRWQKELIAEGLPHEEVFR